MADVAITALENVSASCGSTATSSAVSKSAGAGNDGAGRLHDSATPESWPGSNPSETAAAATNTRMHAKARNRVK
jgi:hypothetical protein